VRHEVEERFDVKKKEASKEKVLISAAPGGRRYYARYSTPASSSRCLQVWRIQKE
jgi:hypothetical protein